MMKKRASCFNLRILGGREWPNQWQQRSNAPRYCLLISMNASGSSVRPKQRRQKRENNPRPVVFVFDLLLTDYRRSTLSICKRRDAANRSSAFFNNWSGLGEAPLCESCPHGSNPH